MRWIITGVQGFIGASLGDCLLQAGDQVFGVDRKSSPAVDWRGEYLSIDAGVDSLEKLIRDFQPDAIFHAIGTASVKNSFEHPMGDFRGAALTWMNLLESVRKSGLKPLIFFPSSAAVYGDQGESPLLESASLHPLSPYGYHKWCCELLAEEYAKIYGQQIYLLRLFSLFGVRQRRLLVWEIHRQIQSSESRVRLYGTGNEFRDYLWIDDFSKGVRALAGQKPMSDERFPVRLNIARGSSIRLSELTSKMIQISGKEKVAIYEGRPSAGDPSCWIADISLLKCILKDWNPSDIDLSLQICMKQWD